jgi:hypothetical protein
MIFVVKINKPFENVISKGLFIYLKRNLYLFYPYVFCELIGQVVLLFRFGRSEVSDGIS